MSQYAQTIVVGPAGDHDDVIRTVAHASVACLSAAVKAEEADPAWIEWLGGSYAKIVKRTSLTKVERIAAETDGAVVRRGREAVAVALPPMLPAQRPALVVKAQASGLQRERTSLSVSSTAPLALILDETLGMSTGKAAAQAAHAAMSAFLSCAPKMPDVDAFMASVSLEFTTSQGMDDAITRFHLLSLVEDAGRSEVAPGSRTAIMVRR